MGGTYSKLLYHVVFSTKDRRPWLRAKYREHIYQYIAGIIRGEGGSLMSVGGTDDHIHLLVRWRTDVAVSELVRRIKRNSSVWVHKEIPELGEMYWQSGYGVFTVSESNRDAVRRYIDNQEEHHRERTFQEEFESFLKAHGVEYDAQYLWD